MFSRFFGKRDKSAAASTDDAQDSRGQDLDAEKPVGGARSSAAPKAPVAPIAPIARRAAMLPPAPVAPAETVLDFELPSAPMVLQLSALEQRRDAALLVVDRHHHRVANTIRTMWGYKECGIYINKLIMSGGDGMGQARVGFNQDAVQAMLQLSDLHDAEFGPPDMPGGGLSL